MKCVIQDPRTFVRCGQPATSSYPHPLGEVHTCAEHEVKS